MIRAIRSNGYNTALTQLLSQRLTVVTFVETQTLGSATAFADPDPINRLENFTLVIPVGFAQSKIEGVAVGVNHQVAFEAANTVFA